MIFLKGHDSSAANDGADKNVMPGQENAKNLTPQEKEIEELKSLAQEYKDSLQRLQAEFENARKRDEREREEFRKFVNARLLEEFLPLVDSVYEGIKIAQKKENTEMKEGFEKVAKQLLQILGRNGIKPIESVGKKFNHELHDVLLTGKDESKQDDHILEELQRGYTINGKVLRPAKVKVNKRD